MTSDRNLAALAAKIDSIVDILIDLVRQCDPLQLLNSVYWYMTVHMMSDEAAPDLPRENVSWTWTMNYVQNLVAAIPPAHLEPTLDPDEAAVTIRQIVDTLMRVLGGYLTVWDYIERPPTDTPQIRDHLKFFARMDWLHMRRSRFPQHDAAFLKLALSPHDPILRQCFGSDTAELSDALDRQVHYHMYGSSLGMAKLLDIEIPGDDVSSLSKHDHAMISMALLTLRDSSELARALRRTVGERYCDFGTLSQLPAALLDALSWEPGGERNFLAPGPFRGWLLRLTPMHLRPLIKIQGRYLCYNSEVLSTVLYRSVFREVRRQDPDYETRWGRRKDKDHIDPCECYTADWFRRVLRDEKEVFTNYWVKDPETGKMRERDTIARLDDVLIFAESKGGQFGIASPATNFKKYCESLEELAQEPLSQCLLNRKLLEQGELVIYEKSKQTSDGKDHYTPIARFRRDEFRVAVYCGVMLHPFPGPATAEASLRMLLNQNEALPYWCVTVEDLLALADLFRSPTTFVSFLQWRTRPERQFELAMEELDYVWRYFALLAGVETPNPQPGEIPFYLGGTELSARYYRAARARKSRGARPEGGTDGPEPPLFPSIVLPQTPHRYGRSLLRKMLQYLDASDRPGRVRVAAALHGLCGPDKMRLMQELEKALHKAIVRGGFSVLVSGVGALGIVVSPESRPMLDREARMIGLHLFKNVDFRLLLSQPEMALINMTVTHIGGVGEMRWEYLREGNLI